LGIQLRVDENLVPGYGAIGRGFLALLHHGSSARVDLRGFPAVFKNSG
jgi:hypothetical protein